MRTTNIKALLLLGVSGSLYPLTAQNPPTPFAPERICLAENYTSTASTCALTAGISAGHGVVVIGTVPTTVAPDLSKALQDSKGNTYTEVENQIYSGNYAGTIYMWYSRLSTPLAAKDTITLSPLPSLQSWNFEVYDIGPVQASPADVGVVFSNADVGAAGSNNPATGVPGWWTGQTTSTTGSSDVCIAGMTVNSQGSAPAPITSYTMDNNFRGLDIVDFHANGAPTAASPNYAGGALLTMYVVVPASTVVQSHVITSIVPDQAASEMYCFAQATGITTNVPYFTGNYCTGTSSCTLSNVATGDMLIINTHNLDSGPLSSPASVTDSLGETAAFDASNAAADITTWHISPVKTAGTHTITVNNFGSSGLLMSVSELSGQASSGNPVEALSQNLINTGSLITANITSFTANDLIYAWGRGANGSDEGDGYTAIRITPTAEYAVAPAPGPETPTLLPRGTLPQTDLGIQAFAIRPAGTSLPANSVPRFTGNYCLSNGTTCTITNVQAGDMLFISSYWGLGSSGDRPTMTDSQTAETITTDRQNDYDGAESLGTWHIGQVATSGTHTLTMNGGTVQYAHMAVTEFSGQDPANPIDVAPVGLTGTGTLASTNLLTASGNDLIYAWCDGARSGGSGTGDGFAAASIAPTAEYRLAASTPGVETATCPIQTSGPWTIQEVAVRGTITSNNGAPLVSIAVTPLNPSVAKGETQQLTATGTFGDGSTENVSNGVVWTSSSSSVAPVNALGLVTALALGNSTIQASSGPINGATPLTVAAPALTSIAVTPANSSLVQGATQQFIATGTFSDGSTQNLTSSVNWSSSSTGISTISTAGLATGVAIGSTTIQAVSGSLTGQTGLTVTPALVSMTVSPANPSIPQGGTQQFTVTGTYSDGSKQNLTGSVTWNSSNSSVATITATAVATGSGVGSVTIRATSGSINASTTLTVTAVVLVSIAVTPANGSLLKGSTVQFTATGAYSDGSQENVTSSANWTSSISATATISNAGLATGVAAGSTTIQAAIGSISGSTGLTVTASFPGITYDTWVDFEQCPTGAAPTVTCLAASTHGTTGTWDISNVASEIGVQAAAADLGTSDGNIATRGLTYNLSSGNQGYIQWSPASALSSVSFGLWYKTGQPASWSGGPQFVTLYNNGYGPLYRLSDERSAGNNARQIRIAPLNTSITGVADNAWYWITMKWVTGGSGSVSVYDSSLNLVGTVTFSDTTKSTVQLIQIGNSSGTSAQSGEFSYFDDVIIDSTSVPFPVLPAKQVRTLVSIAVTPVTASIAAGTTQQFTATGTYNDGSTGNITGSVTWSSTNPAAGSVNVAGLATGVAAGSATIKAVFGSISGSAGLTVTPPTLVSIGVSPVNVSILLGSTEQFAATGTYTDGSTSNITTAVTWTSSNASAVTISTAGLATGGALGSTTIRAASGSISGSTTLTVQSVVLVSIAVTPANPSISAGATQQFTATGTYTDHSTQNLTASATWSSSNAAVAMISSAGLATGEGGGSATIQAAVSGIAGSTGLTVTASYPGIPYDMWVNFEQCPTGAIPTLTCLSYSTQGGAGTGDISQMAGLITIQSAGADPDGTTDGSHATRGMAYNVANGGNGYMQWYPPIPESKLSFGFWYKTSHPGAWVEGPHFITMYNNTFGSMLRLSDERSSGNNARQIRVSPLDTAVTGIADDTWYWLTMVWVQHGAGTFSVYNTSFNLVGTVSFTDPNNFPVQAVQLGNTSATVPQAGETIYFDQIIVDYTNPQFPLLPAR